AWIVREPRAVADGLPARLRGVVGNRRGRLPAGVRIRLEGLKRFLAPTAPGPLGFGDTVPKHRRSGLDGQPAKEQIVSDVEEISRQPDTASSTASEETATHVVDIRTTEGAASPRAVHRFT